MSKIINFHEIHDANWFEQVVVYLKKKFQMISVNHLYDYYYTGAKLHNACLITVDDGHLSSYEVIYPILKKYNVPAIFFVSPLIAQRKESCNFWFQEISDYDSLKVKELFIEETALNYDEHLSLESNLSKLQLDGIWKIIKAYQNKYNVCPKTQQNMTVEQIRQIDSEGLVEIGAHTMLHPFLANESESRMTKEIKESIAQLEIMLQHPIRTFAYPNGTPIKDFGEREISILKETSIKLAFSTNARNVSQSDNLYAIPRYGLSCGSLGFIAIKLFMGKYYKLLASLVKKTLDLSHAITFDK